MARDISFGEFLSYIGVLVKSLVAVVALRALLLFLGFNQRIPGIDPLLDWLKGLFKGLTMSSYSF
jgi:hypothetical protein